MNTAEYEMSITMQALCQELAHR